MWWAPGVGGDAEWLKIRTENGQSLPSPLPAGSAYREAGVPLELPCFLFLSLGPSLLLRQNDNGSALEVLGES